MPEFHNVRVVLTDIEGTTSSISFVHDVLFPYAAERLPAYIRKHASEPEVQAQLEAVNREAKLDNPTLDRQIDQLLEWIKHDVKATPLKALQGYIWEAGYRGGDYQAHVYDDVAPKLQAWKAQGLKLYVYSSGSVLAQKLFFEFSDAGNLLPLFEGHFDTTVGGKREASSYRAISSEIGVSPDQILFLSDVKEELEAARETGLQVCLLERPGNAPVADIDAERVSSFDEITLTK
ncbi:enolase-phosphatase E1 [Litorivivens lipolytica]|uniref:Enolase-phosphatase E1 n=1 Tax=Litorivivens lipolytica TaxID=1524264 RepID=A0A7W4W590_9GAMM|nr:acireductone synthase [Litorivivens lipolytica]MBB3047692.1 enolase-phosphatase E1 [Litorivivens lipolytica]